MLFNFVQTNQHPERGLPILMTASVSTRGMKGADFTSEAREQMYLETIRFYLNSTDAALVFAENSGWDLSKFAKKLEGHELSRVEFISLNPAEYDVSKGKGWNEWLLITQAIDRSCRIKKAGAFLKVTGRYPILNIKRFIKESGAAINVKGCVFYGDIKDHKLYDILRLRWCGHIGSSILFACKIDEWKCEMVSRGKLLDDAKGYWAEHLIYDYLKDALRSGKNVVCRFSRELCCGGLKGSIGAGIGYSKSNMSTKEKVNRLIGNLIRIFFPRFWF